MARAAWDEHQILPDQVIIFGQAYPLTGRVTRKSLTPFPPKNTIGDYQRQDRVIEAEYILSDFTGGLGIQHARPSRDTDRYADGTAEARYRYLTLGPLVEKAGTLAGPIDFFVEYAEVLFAVKGNTPSAGLCTVYKWSQSTSAWAVVIDTIAGAIRGMIVHDGRLYVLTDSTLYQYDGPTLTWTSQAQPGYALCSFDDKLWRLDNTNAMQWALPGNGIAALAWNAAGRLLIPAGHCKQLLTYYDATGAEAIHAVSRIGVWGYDFDTTRFTLTPMQHPAVPGAGQGACVWQGALYVPVGSSLYKYTGSLVQSMGPDKDDGLPIAMQGNIIQAVPSHTFLYGIINSTTAPATDTVPLSAMLDFHGSGLSSPFLPYAFQTAAASAGAALVTPGQAWHQTPYYQLETVTTPTAYGVMGAALVCGADSKYRLWLSDATGVYFTDLGTGLHNPLNSPTRKYAKYGYISTPWDDLGWAEVDKVALSLDVEVSGASATEVVEVYIAFDEGNNFELIGSVVEDGRTTFRLGGDKGKRFRSLKVQVVLRRGSDVTRTPVMRNLTVGYMRSPRQLDGWEFTLDLTDPRCMDEIGVPAGDLIEGLFRLRRDRYAGTFTYRDAGMEPRTRRVWLHEVIGGEEAGSLVGGSYGVMLLELDT